MVTVSTLLRGAEEMPVARQNALVQKYCAVCHSDAVKNGGLSLQHFDAAQAPPSLFAMLLSKLRVGALGAGGIGVPDKATGEWLERTFAAKSGGATNWTVQRAEGLTTASVLRELATSRTGKEPALYRLVLSCNAATRQGEMQVAWSPSPARGSLSASVDGNAPVVFQVEGAEKMGNGNPITTGPAAIYLKLPLPRQTLAISNLFPNEAVEFSFSGLNLAARQSLSVCFEGATVAQNTQPPARTHR